MGTDAMWTVDAFAVTVEHHDGEVRLRFPYCRPLNSAVKRRFREVGYRWDAQDRAWVVPPPGASVAREWADALRSVGITVHELDRRMCRDSVAPPLAPEGEELLSRRREVVRVVLADPSGWDSVRGRVARFDREGRRKYGHLWDQD